MNHSSPPDAPDSSQIESLLSQFNPKPSNRFYRVVQDAPWQQNNPVVKNKFRLQIFPIRNLSQALLILVILLTLLSLLFIPSVRVIARQIFNAFVHASSNQLEVTVSSIDPDELFQFADPSNFPLTIKDAENQSGFYVNELSPLPDNLKMIGARFDASYLAVTSLYQSEGYKLFLTQHPLKNGRDVFSIGSEAQVQLVDVGGQQGEWVVGGWKAITVSGTPSPNAETSISAVWDSELPQYTLRWQKSGTMFELRSIGEDSPAQQELIRLANELK